MRTYERLDWKDSALAGMKKAPKKKMGKRAWRQMMGEKVRAAEAAAKAAR